jgi:hypothetical protein
VSEEKDEMVDSKEKLILENLDEKPQVRNSSTM